MRATCGAGPAGSTNFGQDASGNNTNTTAAPTTYNDDSQVTSIGGISVGYLDRGNDLRVTAGSTSYTNSPVGVTAKKTGTAITYYVRDPQGQILASYGAGGTLFYFSEFNGSVAALYNTSGTEVASYAYSPYGKTTVTGTAGAGNPFRYIGGIQDVGCYRLSALIRTQTCVESIEQLVNCICVNVVMAAQPARFGTGWRRDDDSHLLKTPKVSLQQRRRDVELVREDCAGRWSVEHQRSKDGDPYTVAEDIHRARDALGELGVDRRRHEVIVALIVPPTNL